MTTIAANIDAGDVIPRQDPLIVAVWEGEVENIDEMVVGNTEGMYLPFIRLAAHTSGINLVAGEARVFAARKAIPGMIAKKAEYNRKLRELGDASESARMDVERWVASEWNENRIDFRKHLRLLRQRERERHVETVACEDELDDLTTYIHEVGNWPASVYALGEYNVLDENRELTKHQRGW